LITIPSQFQLNFVPV